MILNAVCETQCAGGLQTGRKGQKMKTPDEIKKVLACDMPCCDGCPYDGIIECGVAVQEDALAYIQQLESRLAQVERERNAAVSDLKVADKLDCQFCVHNRPTPGCEYDCEKCEKKCTCNLCRNNDKYEWRGPYPENTPDHAKE